MANQGQSKTHTATRVNPTTGEQESREFTQEDWRNRNKAEGWTRPDEPATEGEAGTTETPE